MNNDLPASLLIFLRDFLQLRLGLNYTRRQDSELIRKIRLAAISFDYSDTAEFVSWLLKSDLSEKEIGKLASYLTIGETYFMREKKSFDFLEQIYLPCLIRKRYTSGRHLRIWCAGCASGEEAYSLAIVLRQILPDIQLWDIRILATDINPDFLEKARKGIYTKWSFRNTSGEFRNKYFTRHGDNEFHILPEIKNMVSFASLNLANDNYPSKDNDTEAFDVIFCRNVMIYFSVENARLITDRFHKSLVTGGLLVVSPVEMSAMIAPVFGKIDYAGLTIYQKGKHRRAEQKPLPLPAPLPELPSLPEVKQSKIPLPEIIPAKEPDPGPVIREDASEILAMAKARADAGMLKEAGELCERGITIDKLNAAAYYLLATVMQEQGNDSRAISLLRSALYIDHDFVLAYFLYGILCLKCGDHTMGMKSLKNAGLSLAKLSPEDVLPESDGLTAAGFKEILDSITL